MHYIDFNFSTRKTVYYLFGLFYIQIYRVRSLAYVTIIIQKYYILSLWNTSFEIKFLKDYGIFMTLYSQNKTEIILAIKHISIIF